VHSGYFFYYIRSLGNAAASVFYFAVESFWSSCATDTKNNNCLRRVS